MLRSVLLLVALSVVGCSNIEPEVEPILTPTPRPVSSECKDILKAVSTISEYGNLYRSVYTATEKGSSLSNLPNIGYLAQNSEGLDNALFQLRLFDDSVMRWSDAWSMNTEAGTFLAYAPRNDRVLKRFDADDRYLTPHFPYQPSRACRNQQQNYLM